ncbi:RDD family protein [bacterium]|nr:RDD family protein [bacterium]
MNCWQALGIDSNADKKTIKLAYAKRLKSTRPDDDPEGFVVLHRAYKSALANLEHRRKLQTSNKQSAHKDSDASENDGFDRKRRLTEEHIRDELLELLGNCDEDFIKSKTGSRFGSEQDDEPIHSLDEEHKSPVTSTVVNEYPALEDASQLDDTPKFDDNSTRVETFYYQQADYQIALDEDREFIRKRANHLLVSPYLANRIKEWKFIETRASMLDLNFSAQISDLLFEIVSRANVDLSTSSDGQPYIKPPALDYLNDYFQWDKNWKKYEKIHGREQSYAVFMFTATNKAVIRKKVPYASRRALAFLIDLIPAAIGIYIVTQMPANSLLTFLVSLYSLAGIPIMEASRLQASVGKWILGIKVVDRYGRRLRWRRSLSRHFVTLICFALLTLTAFWHLFTYFKYGTFLQDQFTDSHVIRRKA